MIVNGIPVDQLTYFVTACIAAATNPTLAEFKPAMEIRPSSVQ